MKNKIIYPNYENSILNLTSSLLECFDVPAEFPPLKQLDITELKKNQNVIFLILDGLGNNLLEKFDDCCRLLSEFRLDVITSVFPSTTTAAITSMMTGISPFEHGAIGWSLYFKEHFKLIDFIPVNDSVSQENLAKKFPSIFNMLPPKNIFEKIREKNSEIKLFQLSPVTIYNSNYNKKISSGAEVIAYEKFEHLFQIMKHLVSEKGKKLIVIYSSFPDALEHRFGVYSQEVRDLLTEFNLELEKFLSKVKNTNSSLIISADHGLIDIKKYHQLDANSPIYPNLILPAFPEPRFVSFFVKQHKLKEFEEAVNALDSEFLFMKREQFLSSELIAGNRIHPKIDDFVGNYVGIATGTSAFKNVFPNFPKPPIFKAHHSGLTPDEMFVPLIKIDF